MDRRGWLSRLSAVGLCPPPTTGVELVASILKERYHPGFDTKELLFKRNSSKTVFLHSRILVGSSDNVLLSKKCYERKFDFTKWRLFLFSNFSLSLRYNLFETKICLIDLSSASKNSRLLLGCHSAFDEAKQLNSVSYQTFCMPDDKLTGWHFVLFGVWVFWGKENTIFLFYSRSVPI